MVVRSNLLEQIKRRAQRNHKSSKEKGKQTKSGDLKNPTDMNQGEYRTNTQRLSCHTIITIVAHDFRRMGK